MSSLPGASTDSSSPTGLSKSSMVVIVFPKKKKKIHLQAYWKALYYKAGIY